MEGRQLDKSAGVWQVVRGAKEAELGEDYGRGSEGANCPLDILEGW